jgi:predicted small secreted protein
MRRPARIALALAAALGLAACNSAHQQPPVGIGPGINELQRSPCACLEIPMTIPSDLRPAA